MNAIKEPALNDLLIDTDYLLFDLRKGPSFLFAEVNNDTYEASAFLDHRITPRPDCFYSLPVNEVMGALDQLALPPALYIAHTSFCCSTLLARCIQAPNLLSLREPRVLGVLANEYRRGLTAGDVDPMAAMVFRLLGKRSNEQQQVVIKGTNFTNNLITAWQRLWPERELLLMWGTLEDFLVSMCKHRDEAGKNLWPFLRAFLTDAGIPAYRHPEWEQLGILQQAVWVWVLQIRLFNQVIERYDTVRTLQAKRFLAAPVAVTRRIQEWIGAEVDEDERAVRVAQVMKRDSKKNSALALKTESQRQGIKDQYSDDIKKTLAWAEERQMLPDLSMIEARTII
jgi:hypothetical protein